MSTSQHDTRDTKPSISKQMSDKWCAAHPPVDGDDRTPLEVYRAGLLDQAEFWALVTS